MSVATIRISTVIQEKEYFGYYHLPHKNMITVSADCGNSETTQIGSTPPNLLANMMLSSIVEKHLSISRCTS